jgi:ketosteroid isomerase-like protein
MAQETAEKFIEALKNLEENRDVESIVALFADDAEVNNSVTVDNDKKLDAREFWTNYRATFGEVSSYFRNKIYGENNAALEWTTTGTSADGSEIEYEGVSILEFEGERITRFFAYFNPNKLGRQIEETARGKEA